jgi:DNA-directed RNA polymerase specialized sigma24 family protein
MRIPEGLMELEYIKIKRMVREVAASASSNFPSYVTAEDTEGHLWVWAYANRNRVQKTMDGEGWEWKLRKIFRDEAMSFCATEKAASEGYSQDDLFRYSIPKIRKMLDSIFDYENWQSFGLHGDGQPTGKGQANATGDRVVELIDIKTALQSLPEDSYNLLVWQFKYQYTNDMLGEELGITSNAASLRAGRALRALQKELGRKTPDEIYKPSDRRVVRSSAAARAAVSNQYEGN